MVRAATACKRCALLVTVSLLTLWPWAEAFACRIAVLGDSLTSGYGVPVGSSFPDQLETALAAEGIDCEVINAGVSGDTSAGGLARLDWVFTDQPTHLIVELGANDALRSLPVDQLESNLRRIVQRAEQNDIEVFLSGMLAPPNLGDAYGREFANVYSTVAKEEGIPLYPFFLDGVIMNPDLMTDDGLHPNEAGIAEITRRILPFVAAWLDDTLANPN